MKRQGESLWPDVWSKLKPVLSRFRNRESPQNRWRNKTRIVWFDRTYLLGSVQECTALPHPKKVQVSLAGKSMHNVDNMGVTLQHLQCTYTKSIVQTILQEIPELTVFKNSNAIDTRNPRIRKETSKKSRCECYRMCGWFMISW